jgi:hypothetical protein
MLANSNMDKLLRRVRFDYDLFRTSADPVHVMTALSRSGMVAGK